MIGKSGSTVDERAGLRHVIAQASESYSRMPAPMGWILRAANVALPTLLFLICALLLFRDAIHQGRVFFENDTLLFYYPIARAIDNAFHQLTLPLWTPYIFAGHPLFADGESGMLYPPNILAYLLLPASQALIALRVLRFFLAGLFAYLYGRSLSLARPAATIVGLVFAYGSFMIGQIHHTNLGTTALWLPLILAGIEWALRAGPSGRLAYLMLAGIALGAASLTVHVNPLLMILMFVPLYVLFRLLVCDDVAPPGYPARLRRALLVLVLPVGVGLALGAVQLLPLWELGNFSRGRGVGYDFATGFATPPANLITLIFPYFFRDAADGYWSPWFRWNTTIYAGIAPLVLAGIALILTRCRLVLFFVGVVIVSLLLAFGDYSPLKLYGLLWELPVFSFVRGPARFTYLTIFSTAVLAGFGMRALGETLSMDRRVFGFRRWFQAGPPIPSLRKVLMFTSLFTLLLTGALAAAHRLTGELPSQTMQLLKANYLSLRGAGLERALARDPFEALRYSLDTTTPWTRNALLLLALTALLLWAWYRWRTCSLVWQSALVLLVAVDLLSFAGHFHPTTSLDLLQSPGPAGQFLTGNQESGRVLTLWPAFDTWPDRLLPLRVAEASGYSSLVPQRTQAFLDRANQGSSHFLELLNVHRIVTARGWAPEWLKKERQVFADANSEIYEWPKALPHAFVAPEVRVGNPDQVLAGLADPAFDPQRTVWLEEAPSASELGPADTTVGSETSAVVIGYADDRVAIRAETPTTSFLVLTDSFYPGWTAYVNGKREPIYRADYLFRGVALSAGQHTIEFVFEPLSVLIGAWTSLTAVVFVLFTLIVTALMRSTGLARA